MVYKIIIIIYYLLFFFFKQKTAYEMCGRDWSSDVCSSDLSSCRGSIQLVVWLDMAEDRWRCYCEGPFLSPSPCSIESATIMAESHDTSMVSTSSASWKTLAGKPRSENLGGKTFLTHRHELSWVVNKVYQQNSSIELNGWYFTNDMYIAAGTAFVSVDYLQKDNISFMGY